METSRIPISAIIFDAGDVLVHKIPNDQVKVWNEFLVHFNNSKIDPQICFAELYEKVRTLGSDFKFKHVSLNLIGPEIEISLIEEYEIQKWWQNPDPHLVKMVSKLEIIGYKIGILTDSALPSTKIRKVLFQISPFINQIVSSRDIGVMKPEKEMYSKILSDLEIPPNKALFIAHDPDEISGALESGLFCENFELIGDLNKLLEVIQRKYILAKMV
ncbi:MAG: HAD family hydrolase [Candidatus Heimdallarchaeota archaeon]|nr:MAG: HAD family hydrolase [Candidatus Heimdallarchaeota archaeon]